jgi:hypothetical protein
MKNESVKQTEGYGRTAGKEDEEREEDDSHKNRKQFQRTANRSALPPSALALILVVPPRIELGSKV